MERYTISDFDLVASDRIIDQAQSSEIKDSDDYDVLGFIRGFVEIDDSTKFLSTISYAPNGELSGDEIQNIVNFQRLNDIQRVNKFLEAVSEKLPRGGRFIGCVETLELRRKRIQRKYPKSWKLVFLISFILKRMLVKLPLLERLYFYITSGRNRVISQTETYGRLISCGFKIIATKIISEQLYFVTERVSPPEYNMNATYRPLVRLRRIGKGGKRFHLYKFRTMYPYSEYLQEYVHEMYDLDDQGKFKDDFRLTTWGRIFRRLWIDELPQIINLVKGEMGLVGVRPISDHYFSLYPVDLQKERIKYKPGLIPPFYADMPKSFDEFLDSERNYLRKKQEHPFFTDMIYFLKAISNIIIKGARSH